MSDEPKAVEDMTPEELRAELERARRVAHDAEMQLHGHLHNQARHEREIAAVARRNAMEDRVARQDFYLWGEVEKRISVLDGVLYRIEQLGKQAGAKQVTELKSAAQNARHMLSLHRDQKPDTRLADMWEAEARRLRDYITEQARALHDLLAPERTGSCNCQGCDLIHGMDMDVAPAVAS